MKKLIILVTAFSIFNQTFADEPDVEKVGRSAAEICNYSDIQKRSTNFSELTNVLCGIKKDLGGNPAIDRQLKYVFDVIDKVGTDNDAFRSMDLHWGLAQLSYRINEQKENFPEYDDSELGKKMNALWSSYKTIYDRRGPYVSNFLTDVQDTVKLTKSYEKVKKCFAENEKKNGALRYYINNQVPPQERARGSAMFSFFPNGGQYIIIDEEIDMNLIVASVVHEMKHACNYEQLYKRKKALHEAKEDLNYFEENYRRDPSPENKIKLAEAEIAFFAEKQKFDQSTFIEEVSTLQLTVDTLKELMALNPQRVCNTDSYSTFIKNFSTLGQYTAMLENLLEKGTLPKEHGLHHVISGSYWEENIFDFGADQELKIKPEIVAELKTKGVKVSEN